MNHITSSAMVPSHLYVERRADLQLRHIIQDMARPGYVLVARQMGKTNLLLHAKEKYQSDKEIYVYIDFSTMAEFSEEECLNAFIDTAIEINWELFADAESKIEEIRSKSNYKASKMFSRELRVLLTYVDKIVFILDEIDALTRRDYSDRIFSLIRGHYFASTNFPELKRATFILSGVIEPKDIIKDPHISPFNIGEKIYLLDFSHDEFLRLAKSFPFLATLPQDIIDRLYYWTKGQPRMSWDLCVAAERENTKSVDEIDNLVNELYLKSFDKAPIDSIREMVTNDPSLRDAVIQLSINKGASLSSHVKSRLYLAGIINWENRGHSFKNPIMSKSLSYEWLMNLQTKEMNFLAEAEKGIRLERDYKKAISLLESFLDSTPSEKDRDKAVYLLSLAYFRAENFYNSLQEAQKFKSDSGYYNEGQLLKAYNYYCLGKYDEAAEIIDMIINQEGKIDSSIYLRGVLAFVSNNIDRLEPVRIEESFNLLEATAAKYINEISNRQLYTAFYYYLSVLFSLQHDLKNSIRQLDYALLAAIDNEKPLLLYRKVLISKERSDETLKQLYGLLEKLRSSSLNEDFENKVALNITILSEILALFLLDYKEYDITPLLRGYFVESKENAVELVYKILEQSKYARLHELLRVILELIDNPDWLFEESTKVFMAVNALDLLDDKVYAEKLMGKSDLWPESSGGTRNLLLDRLLTYYLRKGMDDEIIRLAKRYVYQRSAPQPFSVFELLIRYNECLAYKYRGDVDNFMDMGARLLDLIDKNRVSLENNNFTSIKPWKLNDIYNSIAEALKSIQSRKNQLYGLSDYLCTLGRNQKIRVRSLKSGKEEIGKLKNLLTDIENGTSVFIDIVK